ncbi:cation diffusion facilitator family transporter [Actinomycetes bacterium NPDC127524]
MLDVRESLAHKVAWISLVSNIILMLGKILIGWYGNSDSVFADGIHSAADVFASVIVLIVIKIASKPADAEHPYGHGKAEVIVSSIVGIILLVVALYIAYEALTGFLHPVSAPSILALWVALISYVSKLFLYRYSFKAADEHNSKAIEAIALDHKADIVASLAAAIGVILSIVGGAYGWDFLLYGDKLASIFVAYLIFRISKEMITESYDILLERSIDGETLKGIESIILTFKDVKRIDKIRAREQGHYILVDARISLFHDKTIKEGHDITKAIRDEIMKQYSVIKEVLIHVNPYYPEDALQDDEKNQNNNQL